MESQYFKEIKDGETTFRMAGHLGGPGREVKTTDYDLDSYINHCLYPIYDVIHQLGQIGDDDLNTHLDIIDRLCDAAHMQLGKMSDFIYKDMGWVKIKTTNEQCRGSFLQQDFLEAYIDKKKVANKAKAV